MAIATASASIQSSSRSLIVALDLRCFAETRFVEQLGLAMRAKRGDDLVEIAVDHAIQLVERQANAVIGDAILREVVRAHLLAALARRDHRSTLFGFGRFFLFAFDV